MIEVGALRVVLPPDTVALYGVDLVVEPGEFVVIIGRSGAGKTTFLRSINRLVEPTAGTVRVAGQRVTGADPGTLRQIRRQIGMIFQQFNLVRRASVLDNVLAGRLGYVPEWPSLLGRFPAHDRALARDCLAQVGLAEFANRRADTLSGGEQQRVAIARALVNEPTILLADEPTGNLDTASGRQILDLLDRMNDDGITLVVVTHDPSVARRADRVIILVDGRIARRLPGSEITGALDLLAPAGGAA
jgi:phosphonate transport system ATP-binding protein